MTACACFCAPHPGAFVKRTVLDPLHLSMTEAAKALGVTRPSLSAVLNARASLTSEMALWIKKAFRQARATALGNVASRVSELCSGLVKTELHPSSPILITPSINTKIEPNIALDPGVAIW
ncbi:MAG: HigA family addiction module antitoxin [Burkholderiales bacterium]